MSAPWLGMHVHVLWLPRGRKAVKKIWRNFPRQNTEKLMIIFRKNIDWF